MAALGEYLYFCATKHEESPENVKWHMDGFVISYLVSVLRSETEDTTVKFYACKAIENITAQRTKTGVFLASADLVNVIVELFHSTENEGLKSSAIVAIQHIIFLNHTLIDPVITQFKGVAGITAVLYENSVRVKQALLAILNLKI